MIDAPPTATPDWRDAVASAHDFSGAKLALFLGPDLLVYRRDAKPDIPWPGCWDLAGGGREGDETPFGCAARELREEFGLDLAAGQLVWARSYPSLSRPTARSWFMVARVPAAEADRVRFGEEGQEWRTARPDFFLNHPEAVPYLRERLAEYIEAERSGRTGPNAV